MIHLIVSDQTNPYLNIAVENHLMLQQDDTPVTLYLWRNRRTVVIGQNQNPYAECDLATLEADGGFLMRRTTGGGAVYHDDNNLNFSFVVPCELYDQTRQFSVLQSAVASFGLHTEVSGRNDVLVECPGMGEPLMRKFSGNAFSRGRQRNLHHGTILINSNMSDLQRYLRPRPSKLLKHGVSSVQSRVVNLAQLNPDITAQSIVPRLQAAFEATYGEPATLVDFAAVANHPDTQQLYQKYASDEWRFGRWNAFEAQRSAHFDWGDVDVCLHIDQAHNTISHVDIATDSLDLDAIEQARQLLTNASTTQRPNAEQPNPIVADILDLVY